MAEFLAMGGYAVYVWPSYGLAALIFIGLLVRTRRALAAEEKRLKALEAERAERRRKT